MTSLTSESRGFVLVAVIWVLAAMALLVTFIATQLEVMQNQSFAMEENRVEALDRLSLESVVLYLASTRTTAYAGLRTRPYDDQAFESKDVFSINPFVNGGDELHLDARAYQVRGDHTLRLQNAGSLISLRGDQTTKLKRLLQSYSVTPSEVGRLIATLTDYTDRNDLASLDGAERSEYKARSMLEPTNRFLVNPWQLYNVMGWKPFLDSNEDFFDEVTIYVGGDENYNTMSARALREFSQGDTADAERLIEYRRNNSFENLRDVLAVSGAVYERDQFAVTFVPSRYLRMQIGEPRGRKEHWIGITLTPNSNLAPWEVDYRIARITTETTDDNDRRMERQTPPTTLLQ